MARRNKNNIGKERIIMLASAVFVLAALTVTGVYVRKSNRAELEDYVVDFETLEQSSVELADNMVSGEELDTLFADIGTDDLDYDPSFQEANSLHVENTENASTGGQKKSDGEKTDQTSQNDVKMISEAIEEAEKAEDQKRAEEKKKDNPVKEPKAEQRENGEEEAGMFDETVDTVMSGEVKTEGISTTVQPELTFSEEDDLVWPIVGNVLINYSMDSTIYFPTLDQYKYNPAIVIAANQGETIGAAANGRVSSVSYDRATGNTVVMELGNGYELTYGQLDNITVSEGSYVEVGDAIGTVAVPTKYYSLEGANVYFKLTKDGEPVNPLTKLK
ncbi:MAG: M23 family metallopeptidase [Bacteroidales bacterium]|nr:M23 family metallopeptidase [Bacteroidales bacterium]MCM1416213.1 M23 family metallopeptidase [bacterium]MCM1424225.1 M23 family metallopeptidase [bacterium]